MKLADIIKYYKGLPRQVKALEVAREIPDDSEFARIWKVVSPSNIDASQRPVWPTSKSPS